MNNKFKRIASLVLVVAMLLAIPAFGYAVDKSAKINLATENDKVNAGSKSTFVASIADNPGIAGFGFAYHVYEGEDTTGRDVTKKFTHRPQNWAAHDPNGIIYGENDLGVLTGIGTLTSGLDIVWAHTDNISGSGSLIRFILTPDSSLLNGKYTIVFSLIDNDPGMFNNADKQPVPVEFIPYTFELTGGKEIDDFKPTISTNPVSKDYTYEATAADALSVEATVPGEGAISYQWYSNTKNSTEGATKIESATEASYTPAVPAYDKPMYYFCKVTNTDGDIVVSVNSKIAKITYNKADIASAAVSITAPAKNAAPQGYVKGGTGYSDGKIEWSPEVKDNKFAANTAYTAKFTLTPDDNHVFAKNATVKVNDKVATVTRNGNKLNVEYTFPATEDKVVTGIKVDTEHTKKTYVEGEKFDKTGMVITATYDDGSEAQIDNSKVTVEPETMTADTKSVTVKFGGKTVAINIKVKPILKKENFNISIPTGTAAVYTGSPIKATVTVKSPATCGAITVLYDNKTEAPTDVGTYTVKFKAEGSTDYAATAAEIEAGTLTITKKKVTAAIDNIADQTYNGEAKTPELTVTPSTLVKDKDYTVRYDNNTNATDEAVAKITAMKDSNYTFDTVTKNFKIKKAAAELTLKDVMEIRYDDTTAKTYTKENILNKLADAGTISNVTVTTAANDILSADATVDGNNVKFQLKDGLTADNKDKTAKLTITFDSTNYENSTLTLTVKVINKNDVSAKMVFENGKAVYNGEEQTYEKASMSDSSLKGKITYTYEPATVKEVGTYKVTATYEDAQNRGVKTATFEITKADPEGTPEYTEITEEGKTLADAALKVGTIKPADGQIFWIDADGKKLDEKTVVEPNTEYAWKFVPKDTKNYNELTGKIELFHKNDLPFPGISEIQTGKAPDGTTTTIIVPESTIDGATADSKVDKDLASKAVDHAKNNNSSAVIVEPKLKGVNNSVVSVPTKLAKDLGENTSSDLVFSSLGTDVRFSNDNLKEIAAKGKTLTVTTKTDGKTVDVGVAIDGKDVSTVPGGLKISVPVDAADENTVAVAVTQNGKREIIRKSVVKNGKISAFVNGPATIEVIENVKKYSDVSNQWFAPAVNFVSSHELFQGMGDGTFAPNTKMSRGMLVKVLHNLENNPAAVYGDAFTDVNTNQWFAESVQWAVNNGYIMGYDNGKFGPDDNITREQLAVILWRHAGKPIVMGGHERFSDSAKISDYAKHAIDWAVTNGIINGYPEGNFAPQGLATRAEVAQMMMNYLNAIA